MVPDAAWQNLKTLLDEQLLAVLGTEGDGHPYTSLVAFAATADFQHLYFATTRATRKYRNLDGNPRVSLLVDNRGRGEADFHAAMATTILGRASECDKSPGATLFLERHPHLADFVEAPTCALLRVAVERYFLVRRFQDVLELTP